MKTSKMLLSLNCQNCVSLCFQRNVEFCQRKVQDLRGICKYWEELYLELAHIHSDELKKKELDLDYLIKEAKESLSKFEKLEAADEEEFDLYLEKFVNDI